MRQSCIYLRSENEVSKAVTVVAHGLNNKPSVMMPLANQLRSWGSDVLLVQLTGHTPDSTITPLSEEDWLHDLQEAYQEATSIITPAQPKSLYFLGYSLGALINLYLITSNPGKIQYKKMVLLAPAFALRTQVNKLLQLATDILPGNLKIPSFTPKPYRASAAVPVKVYILLYKLSLKFEKSTYQGVSMPVLVVIDPNDEMVSAKKLTRYIHTYLPSWQLYPLANTSDKKSPYAHLILDEHSLGKQNWKRTLQQIRKFLEL